MWSKVGHGRNSQGSTAQHLRKFADFTGDVSLLPYSGHPGCTLQSNEELSKATEGTPHTSLASYNLREVPGSRILWSSSKDPFLHMICLSCKCSMLRCFKCFMPIKILFPQTNLRKNSHRYTKFHINQVPWNTKYEKIVSTSRLPWLDSISDLTTNQHVTKAQYIISVCIHFTSL